MTTTARLLIAFAFVLELAALCYGTLMAWLLTAWFLDDAVAATMQPIDWWVIAGERLVVCAVLAVMVSLCFLVINRWLLRLVNHPASRLPLAIARVFVALPVSASLVGALQFGIEKPYM